MRLLQIDDLDQIDGPMANGNSIDEDRFETDSLKRNCLKDEDH